jgi:hypothetical protein
MKLRMPAVIVILLTTGSSAYSQNSAHPTFAAGLEQLAAARQTRTDVAYASAEKAFTAVLAAEPSNARALVYRGEARIMRGVMLISTALPNALEHFQNGMADMDRAVSIAPDDVIVRAVRGTSYAEFPPYYNKRAVAREDLDVALAHPAYGGLSETLRARVVKARDRLKDAPAPVDPQPRSERHDRFPRIAGTTSPIMAVASVTFERVRPTARPAWLETMMQELNQARGVIAARSATSFEHPGMFLIFAWFQDKQALNDFFYGDAHQRWMRERGGAIAGEETRFYDAAPAQIGIELFSMLPGGMTGGGSLVPREVQRP